MQFMDGDVDLDNPNDILAPTQVYGLYWLCNVIQLRRTSSPFLDIVRKNGDANYA